MDTLTKAERSRNMSAIKSKNTNPEIAARRYLYQSGVRYRCNVKDLPGKPDVANKKAKLVLNINGCFWHGHTNCKNYRLPKTNTVFWKEKIEGNISRDFKNKKLLRDLGFDIFVIWECEIKNSDFSQLDRFIKLYFSKKKSEKQTY